MEGFLNYHAMEIFQSQKQLITEKLDSLANSAGLKIPEAPQPASLLEHPINLPEINFNIFEPHEARKPLNLEQSSSVLTSPKKPDTPKYMSSETQNLQQFL